MGKLLAAFGVWLASKIGSVALFSGWKTFLVLVLGSLASVMIFNVFVDIAESILNWVVGELGSIAMPDGMSQSFSFTTLAAYLAIHLKIAESFALVISVILLKWALVKIPFVKW